jgi:hypothetical protein
MLQPYVLFKAHSYYSGSRKRSLYSKIKGFRSNSTELAEGEEVPATCSGQVGCKISNPNILIHRVPSVEEAPATCSGSFKLAENSNEINRKNAPDGLFPNILNHQKKGG